MRTPYLILALLLLPPAASGLELSIRIDGLEERLETNVRAYLSIEQEKGQELLTPSRLRLLHERAGGEIRRALQPFGYFKPVIDGQLIEEDGAFAARYRVDAGPPLHLEKVDYRLVGEGSGDPRLAAPFPLAEGDQLDQGAYESGKQLLQANAVENGYLNAAYAVHELRVDLDRYAATIRLQLDTGPRFRFGEVRFIQDEVDPALLRRYLDFAPGDPFSQRKLLTLQSRLNDSEYFSKVEIRTLRLEAVDGRVPIEVYLTPNKRDRYRAGLGYSTDSGPRLTLDWKRRLVNEAGHRLAGELRLSPDDGKIEGSYLVPLENPAKDALTFGASLETVQRDDRREDIALVKMGQSISLENGWRRTLELAYSYEDFSFSGEDDSAFMLVPSVQWSRMDSAGVEFTRHGHTLDLRIEGAAESLLSHTSYIQLRARGKIIQSLGEEWRLLARADLGATLAGSLTDLPASKRFFAGGDTSIRGFDLDELGPGNASGTVGGRYLAVGSLELERRLFGKWSAATFIDFGNAFDPDYTAEPAYGAGFGIRWRSPVGPVRVDLANSLSADEPSWRLHVMVGPDL